MTYAEVQSIKDPFWSDYVCKDGRQIHVVAPGNAVHQKRLCKALGILEHAEKLGIPEPKLYETYEFGWGTTFIPAHDEPLKSMMKEAFLKKDASEWDQVFGETGIPAVKTLSCNEFANSDHAQDSGLMTSINGIKKPSPFSWVYAHSELTNRTDEYLRMHSGQYYPMTQENVNPHKKKFYLKIGFL